MLTTKRFTPKAVQNELERARVQGKPGVAALEAALKDLGVGRFTPSQLERRARRLFRQAGLPDPLVEVDGWSVHAAPGARRNDFSK